jgi:uncharacterized damage-inducible protein DinB
MNTTLLHQYQLVISSRGALLDYCETISTAHLAQPVPSFNNDSMGSQMRHVANTYLGWLVNFLGAEQRPYFNESNNKDLPAVRGMFEQVNQVANNFLQRYKNDVTEPLSLPREGDSPLIITPLELFTHVITHEFHHKGQIVNMSRQLGYTPVDTDAIRT